MYEFRCKHSSQSSVKFNWYNCFLFFFKVQTARLQTQRLFETLLFGSARFFSRANNCHARVQSEWAVRWHITNYTINHRKYNISKKSQTRFSHVYFTAASFDIRTIRARQKHPLQYSNSSMIKTVSQLMMFMNNVSNW